MMDNIQRMLYSLAVIVENGDVDQANHVYLGMSYMLTIAAESPEYFAGVLQAYRKTRNADAMKRDQRLADLVTHSFPIEAVIEVGE